MDSKGIIEGEEDMANCYSYLEMLGLPSKLLGFGGSYEEGEALGFPLIYQAGVSGTSFNSAGAGTGTCIQVQQMSGESSSISSLSSSPTSTATNTNGALSNSSSKPSKKKQERKEEAIKTNNHTNKKAKSTVPQVGSGTIKVRKEKLGERIMALQQLVSPFGKSDTASVLHEALGYIRFLHDQVQVLSSPYLQHLPSSPPLHEGVRASDLRSRGLCLVPASCTEHIASTSGADLWSPSVRKNNG